MGHTPSEQIFEINADENEIKQIHSAEIVSTSQPILQVTTTSRILSPRQVTNNASLHNNSTARQKGRQRRQQ